MFGPEVASRRAGVSLVHVRDYHETKLSGKTDHTFFAKPSPRVFVVFQKTSTSNQNEATYLRPGGSMIELANAPD
jgi:hypothetical protein